MIARKPTLLLAAAMLSALVAASGCGKSKDQAKLPPALEDALEYLPKDAAVVAVVPTNLDSGPLKQLDDLGSAEVKGWSKIRARLQREIAKDASEAEVDAVLGNPVVIGASGEDSDDMNIAIQVKDPGAVRDAVNKDVAKDEDKLLPAYKGVFVWQDLDSDEDSNFNGLKGDMLFAADSEKLLHATIDNSEGSANAGSNEDFKGKLEEMGEGTLLRVVGDSQQLLDNAGNAGQARKAKFVQALGLFWSSGKVTSSGIEDETVVETDNADLSSDAIPLSSETVTFTVPSEKLLAAAAVLDPDHVVTFAEDVAKQVSPDSFSQYEQALAQLRAAGVDLHKNLLSQVKQLSIAIVGRNQYEFRAGLNDGQDFAVSLEQSKVFLSGLIANISPGLTLGVEGTGANLTYVVQRRSKEVARFAIRGNALVGSIGPAAGLPSPTGGTPLDAPPGALAAQADPAALAQFEEVLKDVDLDGNEALAKEVASSLGPTTLSVSETPSELKIQAKIQVGE